MEKKRWRTRCLVFVPNTQVETKGSDLTCHVSTHHATHHQIVIFYIELYSYLSFYCCIAEYEVEVEGASLSVKFKPCTRRKLTTFRAAQNQRQLHVHQQRSPKINSQREYIAWHKMAYHTEVLTQSDLRRLRVAL